MPILRAEYEDSKKKLSPAEILVKLGPCAPVRVGWPLVNGSPQQGAPNDQIVTALVDTGATNCCIDNKFAAQMNLKVIDQCQVGGVAGQNDHDVYMGRLSVDDLGKTIIGRLIGVDLQNHTPVILGRDFLFDSIMIYDGSTGLVTLTR
jgi:gag-polyprotein putative aspartyl protease